MEHIPTTESYLKKVIRIAKELDISIDEAGITCDAFELAFSDEWSRRAIFGMIEQLDESAFRNGEPMGLIISYSVEVSMDGIRVNRHVNDVPPGQIIDHLPTNTAMIFVKIKNNFPTQRFLGPLIVERPELESVPGAVAAGVVSCESKPGAAATGLSYDESQISSTRSKNGLRGGLTDSEMNELPSLAKEGCQPVSADGVVCSDGCHQERDGLTDSETNELPSLAKEGWQPASADGVVCSGSEMKEPAILLGPSSLELAGEPICLGPIRLKFNERFPFVSATGSKRSGRMFRFDSSNKTALEAHLHLPPWAALQAGTPAFQSKSVFQSASGLSPPPAIGELGHSERKMSHCDHSCISGQFSIGGFKKPRMH